jgi:uncharacterized protein YjbI with pentapeptide repeats
MQASNTKKFWNWIGAADKSILELMQIVFTGAIPALLAFLSYQQGQIAEAKKQHETISTYLAQMTQLQLDRQLLENLPKEEPKSIASATTLNTLRQLDGEPKGQLLRFLYTAGLTGQCKFNLATLQISEPCQDTILVLRGAKLDEITFEPPAPLLQGIDLTGVSLVKADMPKVDLTKANLTDADLRGAIKSGILD